MIILKLFRNAILTTILPTGIVWIILHKLGMSINFAYAWSLTIAGMTVYGYFSHKAALSSWQLHDFLTKQSQDITFPMNLIAVPVVLVEFFLMFLDAANFVTYLAAFLATLPSLLIHDTLGNYAPQFMQLAKPAASIKHYHSYHEDESE